VRAAVWHGGENLTLEECPIPTAAATARGGCLGRRGHSRWGRIGLVEDPEAAAQDWNPVDVTFTPDSEAHQAYTTPARLFEDCYAALTPLFPRLAPGSTKFLDRP